MELCKNTWRIKPLKKFPSMMFGKFLNMSKKHLTNIIMALSKNSRLVETFIVFKLRLPRTSWKYAIQFAVKALENSTSHAWRLMFETINKLILILLLKCDDGSFNILIWIINILVLKYCYFTAAVLGLIFYWLIF